MRIYRAGVTSDLVLVAEGDLFDIGSVVGQGTVLTILDDCLRRFHVMLSDAEVDLACRQMQKHQEWQEKQAEADQAAPLAQGTEPAATKQPAEGSNPSGCST